MKQKDPAGCCGKCEKAKIGTCSKIDRKLAALKPPAKEPRREV